MSTYFFLGPNAKASRNSRFGFINSVNRKFSASDALPLIYLMFDSIDSFIPLYRKAASEFIEIYKLADLVKKQPTFKAELDMMKSASAVSKEKLLENYVPLGILKNDYSLSELGRSMVHAFVVMVLGSPIFKKSCRKNELHKFFVQFFANELTPHDISASPNMEIWSKVIKENLIESALKHLKAKKLVLIENELVSLTEAGREEYIQLKEFINFVVV